MFDRICIEFEEVTRKVSQLPSNTAQLVELIGFVQDSQTTRLPQLSADVNAAGRRLLMLLDYTILQRKFIIKSSSSSGIHSFFFC